MATNPLVGSPSVAERTSQQSLVFKTLAKRIASTLRCGLPGIITDFNPATQYAKVLLAITENLLKATGLVLPTPIPVLEDVLVILPGDANWCLTFPSLVNSECYVCFADMCINEWSTHGFQKNVNGNWVARNQEVQRRHDLSDGFAILAPRSQKTVIPNYSTTKVELRSMDNATKITLSEANGIQLIGDHLELDFGTPVVSSSVNDKYALPVLINGVTWYLRLSDTV
jgi:hypothetical protein